MKKTFITIAILLGLCMTTYAEGGGLFKRGTRDEQIFGPKGFRNGIPVLPIHNQQTNQDANTPLGTGIVLLAALGGAYFVGKKRREE